MKLTFKARPEDDDTKWEMKSVNMRGKMSPVP